MRKAGRERDVWRLIALVAASGAVLALPAAVTDGPMPPLWQVAALVAGFVIAELVTVHLETGRHAHTITFSELPLAVALFLAPPLVVVAARVVGGVLGAAASHRQVDVKLAFNTSLFLLEATLATSVVVALGYPLDPLSWSSWWVVMAAMIVVDVMGTMCVAAVIERASGEPQPWTRNIGFGLMVMATNASLALLFVVLAASGRGAVVLLCGIVALVITLHRRYGDLRQRHARLDEVYAFTGALAACRDVASVTAMVLREAARIMNGAAAEMWLRRPGEGWDRFVLADEGEVVHSDDVADATWIAQGVLADDAPIVIGAGRTDALARRYTDGQGWRDCIAAPLRMDGGVAGVLVVADRRSEVATFVASDAPLFEAIANNAGVAVHNAMLIERLKEEVAEREHLAMHDPLTGLPNRVSFEVTATQQLSTASGGLAVGLMDLDRFKEVNDTLGHHAGDELLKEVGRRLVRAAGPTSNVARLGGDEFAVLLAGISGEAEALERTSALREALVGPFSIGEVVVDVTASVGVVVASEDDDAATLLQKADVAMYLAKGHRDDGVELYDWRRDDNSSKRLALAAQLRRTIESGEIEVHYQPKADLRTGHVVGVEALARWQHHELGPVSPDRFVHLAEHTGVIRSLTRLVVKRALEDARRWRDHGHEIGVAVNLSPRDLVDAALPDELFGTIAAAGVPASAVTVEITEGSLISDPERAARALRSLANAGVRVAIDDFGVGYSSLSYLSELPVSEIKIDRSFIRGLLIRPQDSTIVQAIIDLAHNLGLAVVAEGVEDAATADALRLRGVDVVQGWWLGRAQPVEGLERWLDGRAREIAASAAVSAISSNGAGGRPVASPHATAGGREGGTA